MDLKTIKEKKHYEDLKRKTHYYLDKIYKNNYSPRPVIGSCSYLYNALKPISYQDFFDKYLSFQPNVDPKYRGRSLEELINISKDFEKKSKEEFKENTLIQNLTFEDFFDLMVLHIIIETFDGHIAETYYKELYNKNGCEIIEPNDNDDALYGIDFIVKGKNGHKHYIQVKPRTFATSVSSTSYDRANHFNKENMIKEKYGNNSSLEYIFYERGEYENDIKTYLANDNGKIRFLLSDISEKNGKAKYPSKMDFQNKFKLIPL